MPSTKELILQARQAGYQVSDAQQIRANRWVLLLEDAQGAELVVLVQARPLIASADVQDLAELVQLRHGASGLLWAYGGAFSPAAQRTMVELSSSRLRLCTALPPAAQPEGGEPVKATPALRALS